jgi:hypothetical protein
MFSAAAEKLIRTRRKNMGRPDACRKCFFDVWYSAALNPPFGTGRTTTMTALSLPLFAFGQAGNGGSGHTEPPIFARQKGCGGFPKGEGRTLKYLGFFRRRRGYRFSSACRRSHCERAYGMRLASRLFFLFI